MEQAKLAVSRVIREIEIWRVAVLMVNRYADEAKLNSLRRFAELTLIVVVAFRAAVENATRNKN